MVPGHHHSMVMQPHAAALALAVDEALAETADRGVDAAVSPGVVVATGCRR
jgi:hypothetical protein